MDTKINIYEYEDYVCGGGHGSAVKEGGMQRYSITSQCQESGV